MKRALAIWLLLTSPALALELDLPNAQVTKTETTPADSTRLPETAWIPGTVFPGTEGAIRRRVITAPGSAFTTLQLLQPLREQLSEQGYAEVFACADAECGGFDFRFQLDLIGEPDMHVDLGNFRYVLLRNPDDDVHSVALVASSSSTAGYVHITEVSDAVLPEAPLASEEPVVDLPETPPQELIATLQATGHAVLNDLTFATGSTDLGEGPFPSLQTLASWLADNPTARIVLVGHTDAVGSLEANTSLSQRRAAAVARRLTDTGTETNQLQAAGAGYLSPIASNLTPEGRAANRRVEVVLLSLE